MIDKSFAAVKFAGIAAKQRKGCSLLACVLVFEDKKLAGNVVDYGYDDI